jgi:DNA-binding transcriptional MerR regulator
MTVLLVGDVAEVLGLTENGVRFLERGGKLPAFARTPGGVRVFDSATVERVRQQRAARARGRH